MSKQLNRVFDRDFKINAVNLILNKKKKVAELARDLKVSEGSLHKWRRQYLKDAEGSFPGKGQVPAEEEELKKLRRKLQTVEEERYILKKALGIFSRL